MKKPEAVVQTIPADVQEKYEQKEHAVIIEFANGRRYDFRKLTLEQADEIFDSGSTILALKTDTKKTPKPKE